MTAFIDTCTWPEICREWVLRAGIAGSLPFLPQKVGSAWNSRARMDVVGINWLEKTLILGECAWTLDPVGHQRMAQLVDEKAACIIPPGDGWQVYFLGFSRSGWTRGALAYQDEINARPVAGSNWVSSGMQLIDLEDLDAELVRLTNSVESNELEF
jgi:hypothetical protein